jgi:methyltransferase-like protein/SAM-dependent methyltransferase
MQSHPNRLNVVATLFGMTPAPVERCRVLELGCASGGNLLPMAESLPEAHFVGLDYSGRQVADANKIIETLGLPNIELRCQSITDVDASLGKFDYIICHGVYSWVAEPVRQRIFEICARHLNPQGVAYISYNTYPGWHLRRAVREMMLYHARRWTSPNERAAQARALLDFLARVVPQQEGGYALFLRAEMERLRPTGDNYILHEHLEIVNEPVYFHQFAEAAAAEGLQFLGEAQPSERRLEGCAEEARTVVNQLSRDIIEYEQYLDFLQNRAFRQTLLCHQDVVLDRNINPQTARNLFASSPAVPQSPVNLLPQVEISFQVENSTITTSAPLLKTALNILGQRWPEAISITELAACVRTEWNQQNFHPEPMDNLADQLALNLTQGFTRGINHLFALPPKLRSTLDAFPRASPLARFQAVANWPVISLMHTTLELSDLERVVLELADGTRSREQLLECLWQGIRDGRLALHFEPGKSQTATGGSQIDVTATFVPTPELPSDDTIRANVSQLLDTTLFRLTKFGLMCA